MKDQIVTSEESQEQQRMQATKEEVVFLGIQLPIRSSFRAMGFNDGARQWTQPS